MANVTWADALTAVGTVLAVVVALGLAGWGAIAGRLWRPKLGVLYEPRSPDYQIIRVQRVVDGKFLHRAVYCRVQIHNTGSRRANGVQVRMIQLWRLDGSGRPKEDEDFVPMNLVWTNIGVVELPALVPDLPQHCDFCRFEHIEPPLVEFCTEATPNQIDEGRWPTKKPPGRYRADIAIAAGNAETVYRTLDVEFTGNWSDNVDDMAATELLVTARSRTNTKQDHHDSRALDPGPPDPRAIARGLLPPTARR